MTYLVAGKILRSTEIKSELAEIEISLLMRNNIMQSNKLVSSNCKPIVIQQLKSSIIEDKENYFPRNSAGFVCLPYLLEKEENVLKILTPHNSIETR